MTPSRHAALLLFPLIIPFINCKNPTAPETIDGPQLAKGSMK